ncbi:MAG: hypothetical protein ABI903_05325, partial [Actinomycetota bacterium]
GSRALWSMGAVLYDRLTPGQSLSANRSLTSPNHQYELIMQGDGNLVVYRSGGVAVWSSSTSGANTVIMQGDGNLVIYRSGGVAVWSSGTVGKAGAYVRMQDDGNVVIYQGTTIVWASNRPAVDNFVANNMGRQLSNASGTYPGECVSLVSQYLLQVYGITTGAWGNAVDYRSGGSGGSHMAANGFSWHTDQSFQNGDIPVWGDGAYTGVWGHIAVWYGGKIFDQNYAGRMTAGLDPYFSSAFLGYWRK